MVREVHLPHHTYKFCYCLKVIVDKELDHWIGLCLSCKRGYFFSPPLQGGMNPRDQALGL